MGGTELCNSGIGMYNSCIDCGHKEVCKIKEGRLDIDNQVKSIKTIRHISVNSKCNKWIKEITQKRGFYND